MTKSPTQHSWYALKRRCLDSNHPSYPRYGGRGITFDPRWESFDAFVEDMGLRPEGTSIDRLDVDGDYTKDNCVWSSKVTQMNNRSNTKVLEVAGLQLSEAEWSDLLGVRSDVIRKRLRMGWPVVDAVLKPVATRTRH